MQYALKHLHSQVIGKISFFSSKTEKANGVYGESVYREYNGGRYINDGGNLVVWIKKGLIF